MVDFTKEIEEYKENLRVAKFGHNSKIREIEQLMEEYDKKASLFLFGAKDYKEFSDAMRIKAYELSIIAVEIEGNSNGIAQLEKAMELSEETRGGYYE